MSGGDAAQMPMRATAVADALVVDDVTVRFGGNTALNKVSFTVAPGTIHAVIGPNGAGKSTCFNVLSGIYRASEGSVRLGDKTLSGLRPNQIARLGMARTFQNIALSAHQPVLENLMVARHLLTRSGFVASGLHLPSVGREAERHRARVREVAHFVGIADVLHKPAGSLPYGLQKRVELARALCLEPKILLLDEPVAGLNASESKDMAQAMLDVRNELGLSVLIVEHDMALVMAISDHVTVLDFGRLIADGTPAEVQTNPDVIKAYLGTDREDAALVEQLTHQVEELAHEAADELELVTPTDEQGELP